MSTAGRRAAIAVALSIGALTAAGPAVATGTFCAVTERTADGFVTLREGPDPHAAERGRLGTADFLWVATEACRADFGPRRCAEGGAWVFVERVFALPGSPNSGLKGWANARLIRQVACGDPE